MYVGMTDYADELEATKNLPDIFELVKKAVERELGKKRAGLMLGLSELGGTRSGWIGAYYPVSSNIIVMNKTSLRLIEETNPSLTKAYSFHILLHEYLHTIGIIDERKTRLKTVEISRTMFGSDHPTTKMAEDITQFFDYIVYPVFGWIPLKQSELELVEGFDRSSVTYIT
ncbi:MAG: hypothetical protein KAW84_04115 [Thermoplasmata archaeon]|nr:hypothetical protein [Thermoplasmata archaeon]